MFETTRRARRAAGAAALATLLLTTACGGDDGDGDAADTTEAAAAAEQETTTTAEVTTTEADVTTTVEETTTTEAEPEPVIEPVEPGTGTLTVGGVDYPFTVNSCSFDTVLNESIGGLAPTTTYFEMLGEATAEDRTVIVYARDIDLGTGRISSSIGYSYTDDPNDFESVVIVSSAFGEGRFLEILDTTVAAGPVRFTRTEGVTENTDAAPGDGSLLATCPS
ncbi:MAG: hypothetical protein AAF962_15940 [Actinomycetota bacterium]